MSVCLAARKEHKQILGLNQHLACRCLAANWMIWKDARGPSGISTDVREARKWGHGYAGFDVQHLLGVSVGV